MQQRSISKLRGLSYDLNKLQDNVYNSITPLLTNSINWGIILPEITITSGTPLVVDHTLSRNPLGWVVIDKSSAASVWRTAWNARTITLNANANTTISIYIF